MRCAGVKIRIHILLLFVSLCSSYVFCDELPDASGIYEIRFDEIEPPVVSQKDITVEAPVSNQPEATNKLLECSGLTWLDGTLLISSDRHPQLLFTCPVDLETLTFGTPESEVVVQNEQYLLNDAESLTLLEKGGRIWLYMMCSMSNAPNGQPLPQRRHLLGCSVNEISPFKTERCNIIAAGTLREQLETSFEKIKQKSYTAYNADFPGEEKNTYRWGNVEGITFTPDGATLLCGMRNPLFEDDAAILCAVSGVPEAIDSLNAESLIVTDLFLLDLGQRGISELSWDPMTEGYLITAAKSNGPRKNPNSPYPPNTLDSALFWWSGNKTDAPILIARVPDMTLEAVCRLGQSRYIALGSDEGDVSEGRTARQSIVTVMEFTGIPSGSN